jgi:hypothetical protein
MHLAYAFAAGVVVAGIGASLFAGNPNPPAGPIGPTMVTLDQIAGMIAEPESGWRSKAIFFGYPESQKQIVHTGPAVLRAVQVVSTGGSASWTIFDANVIEDLTYPSNSEIGYVTATTGSSSQPAAQNRRLDLGVTVQHGIGLWGAQGYVTVIYRPLDAR